MSTPTVNSGVAARAALEAAWNTHPRTSGEEHSMELAANSPMTTRATEDDELIWRSDYPGDVEAIRSSPEWALLLKVWKAWRPKDARDTLRSCLLPAYEGFRVFHNGNEFVQQGPPVPIEDEFAHKAVMRWFNGKGRAASHKVLQVSTSCPRTFTVGLSFPLDSAHPSQGRGAMVICDLQGQTIEAQQIYNRLVFYGPEMPEGRYRTAKDGKPYEAGWRPEMDVTKAARIFVGADGYNEQMKASAQKRVKDIAKPAMLTRRFWAAA